MPVLWNVAQEKYRWAQESAIFSSFRTFANCKGSGSSLLTSLMKQPTVSLPSLQETFFCIQNIIERKLCYIISDEAGVRCAEQSKSQVICRWVGGPELLSLLLFAALTNHSHSCLWDICFLGPRGPLRTPLVPVPLSVVRCPRTFFFFRL